MSTPGSEGKSLSSDNVPRLLVCSVKMVQQSKKKLLLDHVVVQSMEEEEPAESLETVLLSGIKAIFQDADNQDTIVCTYSVCFCASPC